MELLNKKELRKVCKDMGMSRKEFNNAYKEIYADKNPTNGSGKYAAAGTLVGMSMIPGLAFADNPPAEVEKVKEENKPPFIKWGGSGQISTGLNESGSLKFDAQHEFSLNLGDSFEFDNWSNWGIFGKYNESQLYLLPNFPVHPACEVDISVEKDIEKTKPIMRYGLAVPWFTLLDGLEIKVDAYPFSSAKISKDLGNGRNKEEMERYVWVKFKYSLPKGWTLGGMTKQFLNKIGADKARNQIYTGYVNKDFKNKCYLKGECWVNQIAPTANKDVRFQISFGKSYGNR